jgi:methionyl aminopeptidase
MSDSKLCRTANCEKPATLRCPTCKELGVPEQGGFCSQECFKGSWDEHKLLHKTVKERLAAQVQAALASRVRAPAGPEGFEGFKFTGKLRPGTVTPRMSVPPGIRKPDYADTGVPLSELALRGNNTIPVLKEDERNLVRKAGR